jgi:hypothetical protein
MLTSARVDALTLQGDGEGDPPPVLTELHRMVIELLFDRTGGH